MSSIYILSIFLLDFSFTLTIFSYFNIRNIINYRPAPASHTRLWNCRVLSTIIIFLVFIIPNINWGRLLGQPLWPEYQFLSTKWLASNFRKPEGERNSKDELVISVFESTDFPITILTDVHPACSGLLLRESVTNLTARPTRQFPPLYYACSTTRAR